MHLLRVLPFVGCRSKTPTTTLTFHWQRESEPSPPRFVQLCQTFDEDEVTQDQMRAMPFPLSLLGKALCWFHTLPAESKQDWDALMRAFMKEFYSPTKTQSLRNKIDTFAQLLVETILQALECFNE
jgi:hypothetical protein